MRLLAPPCAEALVGSDLPDRLPWDSPELAHILGGEAPDGPLRAALEASDVVIAYTRSQALVEALRPCARKLLLQDPSPPPAGPHASSWLARPVAGLLGVPDFFEPPGDLRFSAAEQAKVAPFLAQLPPDFLALHPGSGAPAKNWPDERFEALAARLSPDRPYLLVLGPAERERGRDRASGAVVARELPLRTLGALLSRAGLFVGNDAGISHLAAASGAPTLALFGPTDPLLWSPVGGNVRCLRAPDHRLDALTIDEVSRAATILRAQVSGERTSTRLISR